MGLLKEAKEKMKEKISKQFISFYDSVMYLGEPKIEALEFITYNLLNDQTHLKFQYGELSLISIQRYQDDEDKYHYFTSEYIENHLTQCVNNACIEEANPIFHLGFAKKSFIEMLVCYGVHISEKEQMSAQSPDLAFNDEFFEIDYHTYQMVIDDRDELRNLVEKQKKLIDKIQAENENLKTKQFDDGFLESQGYLNPDNKYFCMEMKLCHDTWSYLYENENTSYKNHSDQVTDYLNNETDCHVSKNAIDRISTVIKPKDRPAKARTNP